MSKFSIFIKGLKGGTEEIENLENATKVETLKKIIEQKLGVNNKEQILVYTNQQLDDSCNSKTLEELGIGLGSTVFLVVRLKGGNFYKISFIY